MRSLALVVVFAIACGGRAHPGGGAPATPAKPATLAERMIAYLPDGVQLLVEVDLARLRANQVVGDLATRTLGQLGADTKLPGLPITVQGSPLANADLVILAAYGVGTANAAAVTLLATKQDVAGGSRLAPDVVALGPPEWVHQLEARAALAAQSPLVPSLALMPLRDHAMPAPAPGAILRITARLPFDARVALARQLGLETAPAQLSVWGDIVDDMAIMIDADAADPGDQDVKGATDRLARALNRLLAAAANEPAMHALGLTSAIGDARTITQKNWVRVIITVGPRQLGRAAERARAMLGSAS
jgi:hypothetical protein